MDTGYQKLNASSLRVITKALEANPAGDLEEVLKQVYTSYQRQRPQVDERRERRRRNAGQKPSSKRHHQPEDNHKPTFVESGTLSVSMHRATIPQPLLSSLSSGIPTNSHIISPLSLQLLSSLAIGPHEVTAPAVAGVLLRILSAREPLAINGRRVIVALADNMVVKLGPNLGLEEHNLLQFLHDHVPTVIAPRALGFMKIGSVSCMFMTRLPGETLKHRWPTMPIQDKQAVQAALDNFFIDLRRVQLPFGSPMGSLSKEHRCKDCRREVRTSANLIYTEAQFNDFITSSKISNASPGYRKWVLSMMRLDHRILLTHGDLHPENIILDTDDRGLVKVGIIDWEMGGFYPEYWEMLKALNMRGVNDTNDWWDFLPQSILGYNHDVAVDRLIESTLL
ncbi:hypothetical protein BDN72DRAFT_205962 [Pluteus cervinus]|uniref:Uncharacterized protein n=1 Tax=Pluteus cervinus TaxID=181527 RepID=A0ACD3AJ66_9AGAR|nr:hypothetical protein BDN72DRAFT_205962 [Pluteus cervinus]